MIITNETSLADFNFWGVDEELFDMLTNDDFYYIETELENEYPNGIDETELNDLFHFEEDYIAQILGYDDYKSMKHDRSDEGEWNDDCDYEIRYDPYMGCFTDDC